MINWVSRCSSLFRPSETNFATAWLHGDQPSCEATAVAYAEAVVEVGRRPLYAKR
ncbi:MAG: hypothetical protein JRI25_17960 [Deltaproteobacteria bacterium]|nr:hypothetical protein [Deltaproteobacteria bacterium]